MSATNVVAAVVAETGGADPGRLTGRLRAAFRSPRLHLKASPYPLSES